MTASYELPIVCTFADIAPFCPIPITEVQALAAFRRAGTPKFTKPLGQKSPALFKRADLVEWFLKAFGPLCPDTVAMFVAAGYCPPQRSARSDNAAKRVQGHG